MAEVIKFDIESLTMLELGQAEYASGLPAKELLGAGTLRMLLGVYVTRLRERSALSKSAQALLEPLSWSELANLRIVDATSSPLLSERDSQSAS